MDDEKKEKPVNNPSDKDNQEKQPLKWDDKIVELVKKCLEFSKHKTGIKKDF